MTTKFLDNKIRSVTFLLSWRFPPKKKQRFGTIFLSDPNPPPLKSANVIFIVVSPSLSYDADWFCPLR